MNLVLQQTLANRWLSYSRRFWFVSLVSAQLVFVAYLIAGYGFSALTSNFNNWNKFNSGAYVANDTVGNLLYGVHVLFAIVMIVGGSLQLFASLRARFLRFHKINGRVFVCLAVCISLAGMYLIFVRGTVGNLFMHSLTVFNGILVIACGLVAIYFARQKKINRHQKWAIRLYLAANGVLFFRLIVFAWLMVFGTLGINIEDFTGPTIVTISILAYVSPLLIYEFIYRAQSSHSRIVTWLACGLLSLITCVFLLGLFTITIGNWYPAISQ